MTKFLYFIGNIFNLLSTLILIFALFFDKDDLISQKMILFLLWTNITTHITERTKNANKNKQFN